MGNFMAVILLVIGTLATIQTDCEAIGAFTRTLGIRDSIFDQLNLRSPNCCSPPSITCNTEGVTFLNLTAIELRGSIISLELPLLESLMLSQNNLTGSIPARWSLPEVKRLDLSRNYLQGSIPTMTMPKLEYLNLEANNQLQGQFPELRAPLVECRIPSSVCYDPLTSVPEACKAMIRCGDTTRISPPSAQSGNAQDGLPVGSIVGIVIGVAAVLGVLGFVGFVSFKRQRPSLRSQTPKILTLDPAVPQANPLEEQQVKNPSVTVEDYQEHLNIISSYK
jgi:hypothetical protein